MPTTVSHRPREAGGPIFNRRPIGSRLVEAGPRPGGYIGTHDRDGRRDVVVGGSKGSAAHQRDLEGREVSRVDLFEVQRRVRLGLRVRLPFGCENRYVPSDPGEGRDVDGRRSRHSRIGLEGGREVRDQPAQPGAVAVGVVGQVERDIDQLIGRQPRGFCPKLPKAAHEQTRAGQPDDGQGHLCDDQHAAPTSAARRLAS